MFIGETYGKLRDSILLLRRFFADPRTVGSIAPSSPALTGAMLKNVDWSRVRSVVELGAGTGVFTKAIIKKMSPQTQLFIFEIDDVLRKKLEKETGRRIYKEATSMRQITSDEGADKVDLIISSIPYAVLPPAVTSAILDTLPLCIDFEGTFIAYQYSLQMKKTFSGIFRAVETRFVALNIPPAFVYECRGLKKELCTC